MRYDFDAILDRRNSDSVKWNYYPEDVLPMWVADMDFLSPPAVAEALKARAAEGVFGYARGNKDLKEAITRWLKHSFEWEIDPEWLVFVPGVVVGMNNAVQALVKEGTSVAYHVPIYPPFFNVAANAGVQESTSELVRGKDGRYTIDWDALEASLVPGTSVFLLCSPHNPVGRVWSREELERLADLCFSRGIMVCSDEIHGDLILAPHRHIPFGSLSEAAAQRSVTLMAPSKTFNIPGLCFSFAVASNADIRRKMSEVRRGVMGGTNLMGEVAALAAYSEGREWLNQLLVYLKDNFDFLSGWLSRELPEISVSPVEGTYLAWLDCRNAKVDQDTLSKLVIEKGRLGLMDGGHFGKGGKGFLRMNFACPRSMLSDGLSRLKMAIRG